MLRLTPLTYLRPGSVDEAVALMDQYGSEAAFMGGGTDLLPNIKHRLASPKYVIGIRGVPEMRGITVNADNSIRIGGSVTLAELQTSDLISGRYPALADSASLISSPQVQRQGTIGGNICLDVRCNYYNQSEHWRRAVGYCMKKDSEICRVAPGSDRCWALSSADTVPVLIALGAEIRLVGRHGDVWVGLDRFYQDDGLIPTTLQPGQIVAEVKLPAPDIEVIYSKLRIRQSFDFPLVGAAVGVRFSNDRTVARAKIVLTAVGSYPIQVSEAEQILVGSRLEADAISSAGELVFRATHPMDNTEGSIIHRKRMARVYVERALRQLRDAA